MVFRVKMAKDRAPRKDAMCDRVFRTEHLLTKLERKERGLLAAVHNVTGTATVTTSSTYWISPTPRQKPWCSDAACTQGT
jgi:hypothetical protein